MHVCILKVCIRIVVYLSTQQYDCGCIYHIFMYALLRYIPLMYCNT